MTEKDAERQFEIKASMLSREQIYLMAKELWCELISKTAENVRLVEREAKLKATLQVVAQMRQAQKALLAKHNEDNVREVNRLQSAVDYRLAELKIHAI
jgi:H2-forming N5,N10-methylenetetrahydromethanopterin dehydrogenase-like enzyme